MKKKRQGKYTVNFENPPLIRSYAAVVGKKEAEGPLGRYFENICDDPMMGRDSWEEAEGELQYTTVIKALDNGNFRTEDMDYLFAGDLLGQTIATSFGVMELQIPHFGLYGACSTMGESLSLAAMAIDGGFARRAAAVTSSHYASAEKTVPFSAGLWQSAFSGSHLDGDRKRRCHSGGRCRVPGKGIRKICPGDGNNHREDH